MASDPQYKEFRRAPLGGTRAQAIQRLQIGISGLAAMVLLVGLANIILERAQQAEEGSVPEAAATVAADSDETDATDPLADAGVVPEVTEPRESVPHVAQPANTDVDPSPGE